MAKAVIRGQSRIDIALALKLFLAILIFVFLSNNTQATNGTMAGNISQMTATAEADSHLWAGFYGNVSGGLTLADSSNNLFYAWNKTTASGQLYATTAATINFEHILCWNMSIQGSDPQNYLNFTSVDEYQQIMVQPTTRVDTVNNTFVMNRSHTPFYVGNTFIEGNATLGTSCPLVNLFGNGNTSYAEYQWEEVILWHDTGEATGSEDQIIYTSFLEENDSIVAFNNGSNDFQLIVAEDGTDELTTNYNIFVELLG